MSLRVSKEESTKRMNEKDLDYSETELTFIMFSGWRWIFKQIEDADMVVVDKKIVEQRVQLAEKCLKPWHREDITGEWWKIAYRHGYFILKELSCEEANPK